MKTLFEYGMETKEEAAIRPFNSPIRAYITTNLTNYSYWSVCLNDENPCTVYEAKFIDKSSRKFEDWRIIPIKVFQINAKIGAFDENDNIIGETVFPLFHIEEGEPHLEKLNYKEGIMNSRWFEVVIDGKNYSCQPDDNWLYLPNVNISLGRDKYNELIISLEKLLGYDKRYLLENDSVFNVHNFIKNNEWAKGFATEVQEIIKNN